MEQCWHGHLLAITVVVVAIALAAPVAGETSPAGDNWTANGSIEETANVSIEEAASTHGTGQTASTDGPTIDLTQQLSLVPRQKGVIAVSHRYRLPDQVGLLEVTLPEDASVTSTRGFVRRDTQTYEWDGSTTEPRLEYRLSANSTLDQDGPIAGPGQLVFTDVGEWALVRQPRVAHRWGWRGPDPIGLTSTAAAENGATGETIAFLGEYRAYTHEAHGQRFRLIVPDRATLAADREAIFASLADASNRLRVGERDGTVFLVAAPTGQVEWGVRGLQTGSADLWVRDIERLDDPGNVWLHEYVHSRQGYDAAPDATWITEGSATYYAALLTLEQDRISFEQFRDRLAVGEQSQFGTTVLAEPATWKYGGNYPVGALVTGELDRRIRVSESDRTAQELLRRMNGQDSSVDADDIERYLRDAGNRSVSETGTRYIRTTERPATWTAQQHNAAFDPTAARITYALAPDTFHVSGPYRDRSVTGDPVVLVPGERLTLNVTATNFGGTAGEYEAHLRADDSDVATRRGRLEAGESGDLQFEHTFEQVGTHVVSIGDAQVTVRVREPGQATVENLSVDRTDVRPGDTVRLSVTVSNDADYPAESTVPFAENGEQIGTEQVRLDGDTEKRLTLDRTLDAPGTYVFGLEDASPETVIVTVTPDELESAADDGTRGDDTDGQTGPSDTDDTNPPPDRDGAGFGVIVAVVALLAAVFGSRR